MADLIEFILSLKNEISGTFEHLSIWTIEDFQKLFDQIRFHCDITMAIIKTAIVFRWFVKFAPFPRFHEPSHFDRTVDKRINM